MWPVRVDPDGRSGPTYRQSRRPEWRRTSNGFYLPASVDAGGPEQRIVEAAAVLPEVGGVTGWASLRWAGGHWFTGVTAGFAPLPVVLAVGTAAIRSQKAFGIVASQESLGPPELTEIDGVRTTTPVRALCFEMRYAADKRAAAVLLGMAAYSDLVSIREMTVYAAAHSGWTGIPQCRDALDLADENSWSPGECRTRHVCELDAGFPQLLCNRPVFDRYGHHVGTPDLLDEESGLVVEYHGVLHLVSGQLRRDRDREAAFRSVGLEYFSVLSGDLADRYLLAEKLDAVRRRSRWEAVGHRAWTTELPAWWVPTFTVDQRRDLDERQRARVLRYRRRAG